MVRLLYVPHALLYREEFEDIKEEENLPRTQREVTRAAIRDYLEVDTGRVWSVDYRLIRGGGAPRTRYICEEPLTGWVRSFVAGSHFRSVEYVKDLVREYEDYLRLARRRESGGNPR